MQFKKGENMADTRCSTQPPPAGGVSGHHPVLLYSFIVNVFGIKIMFLFLYLSCVVSELQVVIYGIHQIQKLHFTCKLYFIVTFYLKGRITD